MPWDQVMHKWKEGKLKSGGSGKKVTSQKQAEAIMLSEKRAAAHGKEEYKSKRRGKKSGSGADHSHHGISIATGY